MQGRSWRWGATRILGLLDRPPVGFVRIDIDEHRFRRQPIYTTRLQTALYSSDG